MRTSSAPRILYIDGDGDGGGLVSTLRQVETGAYCVSTVATPGEALELIASEPFVLRPLKEVRERD